MLKTLRRMRPVLRLAVLPLIGSWLGGGCVTPTPFDTEPSQRGLNARGVERLQRVASENRRSGPKSLSFAALGDTHAEYDDLRDAVDSINRRQGVELVAHMGDMTDFGLLDEYDWAYEALAALRMPLLVTLGNHDAISGGKTIYRKMYGPFDYSFVYRGVKFVFFNSNTLEFPGAAPNQAWLREQVEDRAGASSTVLVTHHPPWSSDAPLSVRRFYADLLAGGKVSSWVHGHIADFQLVRYQGVPVLQCGTFQHWREYAIVTVDGDRISFERCGGDRCKPVKATVDYAPRFVP